MVRVIDAHVHVWGAELLDAPWLADPASHGIRRPFTLDDLEEDLRFGLIDSVVVVAADESLAGTLRLLRSAAGHPRAAAVVGWVDLTDPDCARWLSTARREPGGELLRGIRQSLLGHGGGGADAWWDALERSAGLEYLVENDLVLELLIGPAGLARVADFAKRATGVRIVVDHLAAPPTAADPDWLDGIVRLADAPHVFLKLSGIPFDRSNATGAAELVRGVVGADRLLAGSDWPVVGLRSSHREEWARWRSIADSWSPAERDSVLGRTAALVYRVES